MTDLIPPGERRELRSVVRAPLRRPGTPWRLLVHEWPADGSGIYSDPYHVDGAGEPMPRQAARWRWETKAIGGTGCSTHHLHLPRTEFDELVVGEWLHIEQMSKRRWWMSVGGVVVWVTATKSGRPKRVTVYGPGRYAEPVEGVAYEVDW